MSITDAFATYEANLAASAIARLERILDQAKQMHGPLLDTVYACWTFAKVWSTTLAPLCRMEGYVKGEFPWGPPAAGEYVLDQEKAQAWARTWATAQLTAAAAKLSDKIGNLSDVRIDGAPEAGMFRVRGYLPDGSEVCVDQDRIINVSSKGTLYNQWPARIYLNGKRISEAAYKRLA